MEGQAHFFHSLPDILLILGICSPFFLLCYTETRGIQQRSSSGHLTPVGGGQEKETGTRKLPPFSLLPSILTPEKHSPCFTSSLCQHLLFHPQSCDRAARTHSSRSAPSAAPPLLAVSVSGAAGRRWLACNRPRSRWRRPGACGGPQSWIWHQRRSPWSRCQGDH